MEQALREQLALATDYRQFLRFAMDHAGGCAAFSRRAKFSSRSFLSEVMRGNRRLSHSSYMKVLKAMRLPGEFTRLFQLLIAAEEPDIVAISDKANLAGKIKDLRAKIANPTVVPKKSVFSAANIAVVYAALGSQTRGAHLQDLVCRTKLKESEILVSLKSLVEGGMVREERDRFYPLSGDVDLFELGGENGFREAFAENAMTLKKLVLEALPAPNQLFFQVAFPAVNTNLHLFKKEMRETILALIDKHQVEEGDAVVRLNLGFFS